MKWLQTLFGGDSGVERVDGPRARALVAEGATLLDVRSAGEFGIGHLPGAINIPVEQLPHRAGEIDADRPVVLYCRSGARSARAARTLIAHGLERVHDLGGIGRW